MLHMKYSVHTCGWISDNFLFLRDSGDISGVTEKIHFSEERENCPVQRRIKDSLS
jgi:hypothetical protein